MSLKDDLNAGLAKVTHPKAEQPHTLNEKGGCTIPVKLPPSLVKLSDGQLPIQVQLSRSGQHFSLISPLATVKGNPTTTLWETILRRQYYADQSFGVSVALSSEEEALVAIYHWMLDSITPDQFASLFSKFTSAVLALIEETDQLATKERQLRPLHPQ